MMIFSILYITLFSFLFPQDLCPTNNIVDNRSIYSIGDTLSVEDQEMLFPVCNGSGNYSIDDFFSFSDLNGNQNGGDYKITIISMNATW